MCHALFWACVSWHRSLWSTDAGVCSVPLLTPCSKAMVSQALKDSFNGFSKVQRVCGISNSESLMISAVCFEDGSDAFVTLSLFADPCKWTKQHVLQWLYWASGEFSLTNISFFKFDMRGQELCDLGKDGFLDLAPDFVGDILWEHLEQMMRGNEGFRSQTFISDCNTRAHVWFDVLFSRSLSGGWWGQSLESLVWVQLDQQQLRQ